MKKYSTLLLSSTLLLAHLANGPLVAAQNEEATTKLTETTRTPVSSPSTTVPKTTSSNTTKIPETTTSKTAPITAVAESATASQLNQNITTQQNGNTLSIFYQRSALQKGLKIEYAIWSHENGQDDLKWIQAQDYQTDISLQNFKAGQYAIHAYITIDAKSVFLQGLDINITRPKPSLTTNISEQGVLDIAIQNIAPDTHEVLLPVWSNTNGQDDIKWYTAQRQADGTYTARVFLKHHTPVCTGAAASCAGEGADAASAALSADDSATRLSTACCPRCSKVCAAGTGAARKAASTSAALRAKMHSAANSTAACKKGTALLCPAGRRQGSLLRMARPPFFTPSASRAAAR